MKLHLTRRMICRILMTIAGVCIMGVSVGLFSLSALGMDPFQIIAHGIWRMACVILGTPVPHGMDHGGAITFGLSYTVLSVIMLILVLIINRRKIGLGTVINIFLVGNIADWSAAFFAGLIENRTFTARLLMLLVALIVLCIASALYFEADLGVSVYDALSLTVAERTPIPFQVCRITSDLICVFVGGLLCYLSERDLSTSGALLMTAGIGTIITAFFMGPFIAFFRRTIAAPMLHRFGSEAEES